MTDSTLVELVDAMLEKMNEVYCNLREDRMDTYADDYAGADLAKLYPHAGRMKKAQWLFGGIKIDILSGKKRIAKARANKRRRIKRLTAKRLALIDAANAQMAAMAATIH